MDSGDYRPGTYAVYRGHVYETGGGPDIWPRISLIRMRGDEPVPEGLEPYPRDPNRVYLVHPEQLEEWYRTTSRFRWKNAQFRTISITAGVANGDYLGADGTFPELKDLQQIERYVYLGTFPVDEITDLAEERTDLLAQWREEQARFAAANWYENGTFATYRGYTYAAYAKLSEDGRIRLLKRKDVEPVPEGADRGARHEFGQEYLVEPDRVEDWFSSTWTFCQSSLWREPFEAVGMHKGDITGLYVGSNEEFARKYLKLAPESNPPEYYRVFPVTAVDELAEHREDLLARWWEEQRA